ncbi:MAG: hypothetical protein FWG13_03185 [Leptospirales bacterium]|nr:hypothetical protein [Leptospirales bacterium]
MIKFSPREKKLLIALCVLVAAVVLFYTVINPYINFRKSFTNSGDEARLRINELESIYAKYKNTQEIKNNYDRLMKGNGTVLALVEDNANRIGVFNSKVYNRERDPVIIQNKFKKVTTEVKFEGIDIKAALDLIYSIENSDKFIKTSSLRISQGVRERSNYDITVVFDSYMSVQP